MLKTKKIKSVTVSIFFPICHEVMEQDAMILVLWMLSFKPAFLLSSFTLIKRLFGSSSLSAIRVVSCAHLRLLIFFLAILIPACKSSLEFSLMYSANQLNRVTIYSLVVFLSQFWTSPFFHLCCFLICIQVSQETGKVVWYSYLFKNFPQFVVTHSQRFSCNQLGKSISGILLLSLWSNICWQFDLLFLSLF